jgi:hypothetical protein
VLRGGFTIFDDHNQYFKMMQDPRGNWPFGAFATLTGYNHGAPNLFFNTPASASSFTTAGQPYLGDDINPRAKIPYAMEFNFGIERQLTANTSLSVQYVGSLGRHIWVAEGYNQPLPGKLGPNAFPDGQPWPFLPGLMEVDDNIGNTNYNSLQAKLEKRFSNGLSFLASYTYSRCLDMWSGDFNTWPQDTYNIRADYGPCDQNFPQLFSFNSVYQLPFGQGRHFVHDASRTLNGLIGGWNLSGIVTADSGTPFTVNLPFDNANAGGTLQRPNAVAGCNIKPAQQTVFGWYNTNCFTLPAPYTFGNLARNSLRGPDFRDFDVSLYKDFKFTESKTLQFRSEFFNVLNRVNLSPPGGSATGAFSSLGGAVASAFDTPTFMQIFSAASARQIQFALKLIF